MDSTLAAPHFALGSTYGLPGGFEQSRVAFLRALELDSNHIVSMHDLSYMYTLSGQLDDSLYWARRAWPLSSRTPNERITSARRCSCCETTICRGGHHTLNVYRTIVYTDTTAAMLEVYATTSRARWPGPRQGAEEGGRFAGALHAEQSPGPGGGRRCRDPQRRDVSNAPEAPWSALPNRPAALRVSPAATGHARARGALSRRVTRGARANRVWRPCGRDVHGVGVARALVGDTNGAFAELQRAYDAGWRDYGMPSSIPCSAFCAMILGSVRWSIAPGPMWSRSERARGRGLLDFAPLLGRPLERSKVVPTLPNLLALRTGDSSASQDRLPASVWLEKQLGRWHFKRSCIR